jgi:hypothetical protein
MSSTSLMMERGHLEAGLVPVADAFSGTVLSDVINMKDHNRVRAVYYWGVGATGTITITVLACDNTTPSTSAAVAFKYRVTVAGATPGAITTATSAGFTTTAGSSQMIEIEVDAATIGASAGYNYVQFKSVEVVDSPILGGILIELLEPRHAGATATSAVT